MGAANSPTRALGVAGFGFVTLLASLAIGYQEWIAGLDFATSERGQIALFISDDVRLPLAESGRATVAERCSQLQSTPYALLLRSEQRGRLLQSCQKVALETARTAPTVAIAWLAAASAAAALRQEEAFNHYLVRAYESAPAEQWLGERRVALIEENYGFANQSARDAEAADLAILVVSARGIKSLARRYVTTPGFRERVTLVVEKLSAEDQRRFIAEVKRAAGNDR